MAKKKIIKKPIKKIETIPTFFQEKLNSPVKTRLQELQELYEVLKKEGITSISKLEVMISQLQS